LDEETEGLGVELIVSARKISERCQISKEVDKISLTFVNVHGGTPNGLVAMNLAGRSLAKWTMVRN
jgi:hypothetical protein